MYSLFHKSEQALPDMLPPHLFIDAQIIDEKRLKRHHVVGKRLLPQLAECISFAHTLLIRRNVDRLCIIPDHLPELLVRVLCRPGNKNIWPNLCVNLEHLPQELIS